MNDEDKKAAKPHLQKASYSQRNAGQSIDNEIKRAMNDEAAMYITLAIFAVLLAAQEWWRWVANSPPQPVVMSLVAVVVVIYAARKHFLIKRRIRSFRTASANATR